MHTKNGVHRPTSYRSLSVFYLLLLILIQLSSIFTQFTFTFNFSLHHHVHVKGSFSPACKQYISTHKHTKCQCIAIRSKFKHNQKTMAEANIETFLRIRPAKQPSGWFQNDDIEAQLLHFNIPQDLSRVSRMIGV